MSQNELKRMKDTRRESHKVFNFGTSYKSKGVIEIPVTLKCRKFYLRREVLGDIPWLRMEVVNLFFLDNLSIVSLYRVGRLDLAF